MKYIVILGDGMADIPVPELDNKTSSICQETQYRSSSPKGELGLVKTIPTGMTQAAM